MTSLFSPPALPTTPPRGVFVTGTDTGIGKTLASALLTHAWGATYWKPLQTGLAEEAGDTATVRHLASLPPQRIIPPAYALQAPLAPEAAARQEGITLAPETLTLPNIEAPLVVEGAGGLMVPITSSMMMIDLIAQLGLPVVLVTRSGLGTLNHSLLSLEALYRRSIPVLGFISNGPENKDNQQSLERLGQTRCLFHINPLPTLSPAHVQHTAQRLPSFTGSLT
ncbi:MULTISPECIES: dethiobiotin synthase [unclassified Saccharibacter]|uniref:dethiobiotin synthase n=1 Tax=unclassified Saccharibacter TaxID=2648722 RepID=UPI0013293278|nr:MULTISPECIES: dethiobiotin synthase [unclassified Saccharibacter]MXV36776.1 dethiobiotin synthase [Saccharibacter sp. EH611]MXV58268.1 dethiobiotin synthase [Saccharibacter sp. EH70]MXV65724.1 dethiobiotin synthase [Saccharibacter sp. EH60]